MVNLVIDFAEEEREITRRIRQEWYVNEEEFLHYHKAFQEKMQEITQKKMEEIKKKFLS